MLLSHSSVRPNDPAWALMFGDAIHNLRSALDHIVCQLAILNGNDISCCEKTYFPICICKPDFVKFRKMAEHLIAPNAFTCIEELQPYKSAYVTGTEPAKTSLWIIHQLDIIDKHRILVVVGKHFRTTDIACSFNDGEFVSIPVDTSWRPLEEGAQVAEIDISLFSPAPTDKDKMRVQGGTQVQVLVNETGCACDGVEVGAVLKSCIRHVRDIADLFEQQFFSG